jgi:hypothetical protein
MPKAREVQAVRARLRHQRLIDDLAELQLERDLFYTALLQIAGGNLEPAAIAARALESLLGEHWIEAH